MRPSPRLLAAAGLALAACAAPPPQVDVFGADARRRGVYGDWADPIVLVDAHFGLRRFVTESDFEPTGDPVEVGLTFRTPVRGFERLDWDLGLRYAYDDYNFGADQTEFQLFELDAGLVLKLSEPTDQLHPFIGAGAALVLLDLDFEPAMGPETGDRDGAYGGYVRAGLQVEVAPAQLVGIEVRYLNLRAAQLENVNRDADSVSISLSFGARF